jgi:hypothetical protein
VATIAEQEALRNAQWQDPPRHQDRSLAGISVITNNREDTYESTGIDAMRRQSAGDYAVLLERQEKTTRADGTRRSVEMCR